MDSTNWMNETVLSEDELSLVTGGTGGATSAQVGAAGFGLISAASAVFAGAAVGLVGGPVGAAMGAAWGAFAAGTGLVAAAYGAQAVTESGSLPAPAAGDAGGDFGGGGT